MKAARWVLPVLMTSFAWGCGGSQTEQQTEGQPPRDSPSALITEAPPVPGAESPSGAQLGQAVSQPTDPLAGQPLPPARPTTNASPQEVVTAFLEATRSGDQQLASELLTRKAIVETRKRGLSVQPPGTPSMRYQIGRTEPAPNQGVYVRSIWTEDYADGSKDEIEVVWIMRQQPEGWRIAGMAAQMDPDADPVVIDFEFPDELARRMNAGSPTEEAPADPSFQQAQQPTGKLPPR